MFFKFFGGEGVLWNAVAAKIEDVFIGDKGTHLMLKPIFNFKCCSLQFILDSVCSIVKVGKRCVFKYLSVISTEGKKVRNKCVYLK